ncbi:DUF4422 domain-containing protein [Priestia megaterium]|uniref:DUF4422 domain-containing protein n=1 Tax=Priestia megaterium TaxID=1404 RepID=UPI001C214CED|nr:DUF4422 domain-containing protein [Priestia megaterium]MBU8586946.1 DUF4422 domain-containing protein [Priestia megaterium]
MKDIKIIVATHKKYNMPKSDIYLPIHVGRKNKMDLGYIGDHTEDNISEKNSSFCELTGLYWAWKNLDCEVIGLSHYRRYFTATGKVNSFLKGNDKMQLILNESELTEILSGYEAILPKKRNYYIDTVWSHYSNAHYIEDLEKTKAIIEEKYPEYISSFNTIMNQSKMHLYNMFVFKKELFDKYCEWLFDILFELECQVDISNYDNYQKRIFGFISERLFNVWILHNNLNVKECNVLTLEKINWLEKINQFLKRKFKGNAYG